jgi:hypothetical protein
MRKMQISKKIAKTWRSFLMPLKPRMITKLNEQNMSIWNETRAKKGKNVVI